MIAATSQLITQNSKIMPYGKGGRLGESIDPRLMLADFSGYANAGMIQGQALAGLGQQIGDVIKQRAEQKKQDAVDEKFLQQGSEFFKGTPLETTFSDAYQNYTSEDMTPREKRALAASIKSLIPMGVEAHKMRMAEAEMQMRQAAMRAKGAAADMPISPEQINAAVNMANAAGLGAPVNALLDDYQNAPTPEAQQQIAKMIVGYSGQIEPSNFQGQPPAQPYKISGTPAKVPKGDKMVSEWEVTAPDGSKFTVNAKQKQRLNKAIQSGKPFDLAEVLGEPSMVSRGADFVRQLLSRDEYGTETPKPARPTSLQEKTELNLQLIELKKLAAQGDVEAAKQAAAIENSLRQGGFMGEMKFTSPEQLLGNPFDFE